MRTDARDRGSDPEQLGVVFLRALRLHRFEFRRFAKCIHRELKIPKKQMGGGQ